MLDVSVSRVLTGEGRRARQRGRLQPDKQEVIVIASQKHPPRSTFDLLPAAVLHVAAGGSPQPGGPPHIHQTPPG